MYLSNLRQFRWPGAILSLLLAVIFVVSGSQKMGAQTTATLSGTIQDAPGNVIAGAQVKLTNEATQESRSVKTNTTGLYVFPSLVPGTYSLEATAKGFAPKEITGIELHSGDARAVPTFVLQVGSESQTVSVVADEDVIPVENGERSAVLDAKQINNLALEGRDTTELMKVLPGATTVSNGLSNGPSFSDLNIGVQSSAVGSGIDINGAVNRGGTALLADGASIIDPGDMASSLSVINPNMTQELTVQASNFSADIANGPVVVSAISKSGGESYHGEAYFDARNNVLNANDWLDNHQKVAQGPASYYYPGGNAGGPVPFTHKKVFFWGGLELWRQNLGNSNHLSSFIPSPEMMAGNFSSDNADNQALCPGGFSASSQGTWCDDVTKDTIQPDGSVPTSATGGNSGGYINKAFLDPGAAALAKIWPKANSNPATTSGGYNYYEAIPGLNNGWIWRIRGDYNLNEQTKLYISYQRAHNSDLAQGNGAHLYWTPGNAIPFPGGGEQQVFNGKVLAGHLVHTFNSTSTNDLMAAWSWGSFPFTEPDPTAAYRTTLGYPSGYGTVFPSQSVNIPAYNSPGGKNTFPDFSQASIFDEPLGQYAVRKAAPQFSDTFTKIWGAHTVKLGGYSQNSDNYQSNFSFYKDGDFSSFNGQNVNIVTGNALGSTQNPDANFVMGVATGYSENNAAPLADTAQQTTAFFVDDTWKASHRLTLDLGARIEHVGHWYDRQGIGMAVFIPSLVSTDYYAGAYAPGFRWHGIDPGIPLSGQPNRLAFVSPRLGVSYDVFGNGNTVIRGGWGAYRFVTQVNDVTSPLNTAQHVLGYNLPASKSVMLSQINSNLQPPACTAKCGSGTQWGFDPTDYSQPKTYAYNFTIDQRLKWHTQLDIAYVGSQSSEIPDASEGIEGSTFSALADQNKTPLGAFFKADPVTGKISPNPEKITTNLDGTSTGNQNADYHPFGYAYGTNSTYMIQGTSYTNYNGVQVAWVKTGGRLTYNVNGSWSKTLATGLQENPFNINNNYGPAAVDRPFVFNSSYTYQTGTLHTGSSLLNYFGGGWSISGISTWQAGGYLPALLGNGVPNFGLSESYVNIPLSLNNPNTKPPVNIVSSSIGSATYFGTDASVPIMPVLTCNPNHGLAKYQRLNLSCFSAPAVGSQGGQAYPYMSMGSYFDNDLAIFKSFTIHDRQKVQVRFSAFNWINHPLPQFSSQSQVNLWYNVDYNSKAISLNQCTVAGCSGQTQPSANFGLMDQKTAAPYQRIITLNAKYSF
jgi:hypothetical protein